MATAYNNRVTAYADLKDYRRAILDFTQALQLNPRYAEAYYNRGLAYYFLKNYPKAVQDLQQFLKLAPHHPMAPMTKRWIYQLQQQIRKGK